MVTFCSFPAILLQLKAGCASASPGPITVDISLLQEGINLPVFHLFLSSTLGGIHPETLCSAGIALSAPLSLLSISLSVSPPRPGSSALAIPIGTGPGVPGGADQGDVLPLGLWQLPSVLAHMCVWTLPKVPDFRGWIWCLLA